MSPLLTRPRAVPDERVRHVAIAVGLGVVGVLVLMLLFALVRAPDSVEHLRVVNSSPDAVDVSVSATPHGPRYLLGTLDPNTSTVIRDVPDVGSNWVFHFADAGHSVGTRTTTRDSLANDSWEVSVPRE